MIEMRYILVNNEKVLQYRTKVPRIQYDTPGHMTTMEWTEWVNVEVANE